ncbi:MAG: DNA replication and repair protein RecF [Cyclobacteriaceae bacterium]|nr:DNA replication and repair protein RecF [Cyclobacteriaceae bacterium]
MHLENLRLINFKNYQDEFFDFTNEINCLVGNNGSGKTNLLDAIHYLSLTKSFLNSTDLQAIRHDQDFFSLMGTVRKEQHEFKIKCQLKKGEKKVVSLDGNVYERISQHIGQFPIVLISPNDTDIIQGGNEFRRKFFDGIISQLDREYLEYLIKYNYALRQRNHLLKHAESKYRIDPDLLEPYDRIIISMGERIYENRKKFLEEMLEPLQTHYDHISDNREHITIGFRSDHQTDDFNLDFMRALRNDLAAGRTNLGIHKDEYKIEMDGYPLKKFGSQGQQKSLIVALKLTQFDMLRSGNGFKPILMMDDIFDKLDEHRIDKIMSLVAGHTFGQIFITDARPERTFGIIEKIEADKKVYWIDEGKISTSEK